MARGARGAWLHGQAEATPGEVGVRVRVQPVPLRGRSGGGHAPLLNGPSGVPRFQESRLPYY